ncbi:hypothetical protein W97_04727 [Coniosporium apollinis CBS 100218]|uniref:Elongin-A n=1 Tax=Coniosporium apollinis (strain CBS 100218) TaxID=1168221 RepID=R7YUK4_CONA1|nr:uncharacterized protein W97_04727 [Coniosporium apollinis CBS 100218]EON65489.1 hypothetical protein W97_04727 [Coniosporium apollinis CBS 100218]
MPARSLFAMARTKLMKNIYRFDDLSDLPYDWLRPALLKIEYPDHLRTIEKNSPHIALESGEIWREFIRRDIPGYSTEADSIEPANPASWWKLYAKLKREAERNLIRSKEELAAKARGVQAEREAQLVKVNQGINDPQRRKRGPASAAGRMLARVGQRRGQMGLLEMRRPVQRLAPPGRVFRAPRGLIEEYKRPVMPRDALEPVASARSSTVPAPKVTTVTGAATRKDDLAAREARLKAIREGRPVPALPKPAEPASTATKTTTPQTALAKALLNEQRTKRPVSAVSSAPKVPTKSMPVPTRSTPVSTKSTPLPVKSTPAPVAGMRKQEPNVAVPRPPTKTTPVPATGVKRKPEVNLFMPSKRRA